MRYCAPTLPLTKHQPNLLSVDCFWVGEGQVGSFSDTDVEPMLFFYSTTAATSGHKMSPPVNTRIHSLGITNIKKSLSFKNITAGPKGARRNHDDSLMLGQSELVYSNSFLSRLVHDGRRGGVTLSDSLRIGHCKMILVFKTCIFFPLLASFLETSWVLLFGKTSKFELGKTARL